MSKTHTHTHTHRLARPETGGKGLRKEEKEKEHIGGAGLSTVDCGENFIVYSYTVNFCT